MYIQVKRKAKISIFRKAILKNYHVSKEDRPACGQRSRRSEMCLVYICLKFARTITTSGK